ncbi:sugar ABC transporter permease [bacterium]|nr:sugar ABC transporter permease [candidate division CSSED10-310 bacterium]
MAFADLKTRFRNDIVSYGFLSPFLLVFALFLLFPVVYSLWLSLHRVVDLYDVFGGMKLVWFDNYIRLFKDGAFWWSLLMTLYYAALVIPGNIVLSLALAVVLNNRLPFRNLFRGGFFLPYVLDMLVVGIIWVFIYSPHYGVLTKALDIIGVTWFSETGFLGNPWTAMPAVALALILKSAGFGMILFLAALQNIPPSLYESASIDGASTWKQFRHITLPLLKPIILFIVITGTIGALNAFTEIYAMTSGGPTVVIGSASHGMTTVSGYYLFRKFESMQLGYAAAISYVLFFITLVISIINARIFKSEDV